MNKLFSFLVFLVLLIILIIIIMNIENIEVLENEINEENINSQKYLDICNHFKEIVDEKDKKLIKSIKRYNELFKNVVMVYGILRLIDDELNIEDFEASNMIYRCKKIFDELLFKDLEHNEE